MEGTTDNPQVDPELLAIPYVAPGQTCRGPPPFAPSNSNVGFTDNYSTREMYPAGIGFDVSPASMRFWYPRLVDDIVSGNEVGDNATFFLKKGSPGDIRPIRKAFEGSGGTQENQRKGPLA